MKAACTEGEKCDQPRLILPFLSKALQYEWTALQPQFIVASNLWKAHWSK